MEGRGSSSNNSVVSVLEWRKQMKKHNDNVSRGAVGNSPFNDYRKMKKEFETADGKRKENLKKALLIIKRLDNLQQKKKQTQKHIENAKKSERIIC